MSNMAAVNDFRPCAYVRRRCSPLTKGLLWGGALSALLWTLIGWVAVSMV